MSTDYSIYYGKRIKGDALGENIKKFQRDKLSDIVSDFLFKIANTTGAVAFSPTNEEIINVLDLATKILYNNGYLVYVPDELKKENPKEYVPVTMNEIKVDKPNGNRFKFTPSNSSGLYMNQNAVDLMVNKNTNSNDSFILKPKENLTAGEIIRNNL